MVIIKTIIISYIPSQPDSKAFEEAKAEYKQMHGFDQPKNALVINIARQNRPKTIIFY